MVTSLFLKKMTLVYNRQYDLFLRRLPAYGLSTVNHINKASAMRKIGLHESYRLYSLYETKLSALDTVCCTFITAKYRRPCASMQCFSGTAILSV